MRRMPSFGAIEAFVVAARAESFRAAADALALSPSAFSRRIQMLEHFVDVPLFDRSGPLPRLTPDGARYLADLEPAVETIRRGTDALRQRHCIGPLRIAASLSIATTWLLPRLSGFCATFPDISVDVAPSGGIEAVRNGDADIALLGAVDRPQGTHVEKLIDLEGIPLAAPGWVAANGDTLTLADLVAAPRLGTERPTRLWERWMTPLGAPPKLPPPSASFATIVMAYEAAAAGMGVALGAPLAAERFVSERRLVRCSPATGAVGSSYYVAFASKEASRRPHARAFADWLHGQARQSQANLAAMLRLPEKCH